VSETQYEIDTVIQLVLGIIEELLFRMSGGDRRCETPKENHGLYTWEDIEPGSHQPAVGPIYAIYLAGMVGTLKTPVTQVS